MRGRWIGGGLLAGLMLVSGGGAILADGAEEIAKGKAALKKNHYDIAIHYFTKALGEKGLADLERAEGFILRGHSYFGNSALYKEDRNKKSFDKLNGLAIRDLNQSIKQLQSVKAKGAQSARRKKYALARAYYFRGLVSNGSGNAAKAKADLGKSISLRKDFTSPHLALGRINLGEKKFAKAIESFGRVAGIDPEFPGIYKELGRAYTGDGDYASALGSFNVAVNKNPKDLEARFERGGAFAARRRYRRAIEDFDFVIGAKPDHIDALFKRGEAFLDLKIFDKSKVDFDNLFAMEKNGPVRFSARKKATLYYLRGQASRGMGETESALKDMNEALSLDSGLPGIHKEMGYLLAFKGDHVAAIKSFSRALAQNATFADALVGRAQSYVFQKKYDAVIDDVSAAIWSGNLTEEDIRPLFFLRGRAFFEAKRYKNAIRDLSAAIGYNPGDPEARFYRGLAHGAAKSHRLAIKDLSIAGRSGKDFPDFHWHYGTVLGGAGFDQRAVEQFGLALQKNPKDKRVLASRNRLYARMGKKDLALADKNRIDQLNIAAQPPKQVSWWQSLLNKIIALIRGLF